jgi:small subunit ribosomal protein S1
MMKNNSIRIETIKRFHPWDALDAKLAIGDKVKGKVVVIADYGAFEVAEGVEGLIHVSEMSWSILRYQDFAKVKLMKF